MYAISSTFATWPMELKNCPNQAAQRYVFVLYTPKIRQTCQVLQFTYSWPTFLGYIEYFDAKISRIFEAFTNSYETERVGGESDYTMCVCVCVCVCVSVHARALACIRVFVFVCETPSLTDTKKVTITKTLPLCIVKSLLREVDTSLPLFLLWEKLVFSLQLGKLTKIQFRPKTYITAIISLDEIELAAWMKLYVGGRRSGRICNNHPWGWNDPFPDEYS